MNDVDDTIASIDALIDEQLAEGEPAGGYDDGDPSFPACPHCGSHWHGLPITYRMVIMGKLGWMPDDYTYASDDSPIWCPGSQLDRRRLDLDDDEMRRLVRELTAGYFDQLFAGLPRWARPMPAIADGDTVTFTDSGGQMTAGQIRMRAGRGQEITTVIYDEVPRLFGNPSTTEGQSDALD